MRRLLPLLALLPWLLVPALARPEAPAAPEEARKQVERGRKIYLEGASAGGGKITALMSDLSVEVPATTVPCASCHGRDGRGKPEGGVVPTALTWDNLTKPYGITHASGRKHPAYDERSLKRAIAMGMDPAGNKLHAVMPRFQMSREDMEDLVAYLKVLGREAAPGVSDTGLTVGVLLPPTGQLSGMGQAVRAALAARFEAVNKDGGIYGRRLEARFLEAPGPPEQRKAWAADFLEREDVFAGVGAFFFGADAQLAALFEEKEIPLVGPFTLYPKEGFPMNRYVFYLLPGVEAQGEALVRFALRLEGTAAQAAILAPAEAALNGSVQTVEKSLAASGRPAPMTLRYSRQGFGPKDLARLAGVKADPVFFLGSGSEAKAFLVAANQLGWTPRLLATGTAADASLFDAPAAFEGRIFVALPTLPGGQSPAYRDLATTYKLPKEHVSAQLSALASAEILIEALKRAGRDLSRERLVDQLETLRSVSTGFAPPVTYGPGRRLGARGAYVMRLDLAADRFVPVGGWLEVE
jgi:ABC-type branched-subunit amino acid transport system substrate-binding protein